MHARCEFVNSAGVISYFSIASSILKVLLISTRAIILSR